VTPDPKPRSFPGLQSRLAKTGAPTLHDRLVARDEHALVELIDAMTPWLLGVAQALLQDPDEAEEVVHETFATVWEKIGQVPDDPRGLLAWVLRVGRNAAIDRVRARKRRARKTDHLAAHGVEREPFAEPAEPNEASAPGWHVHQTIHAALTALPPEQQAVVSLAYFQGLTHSEVAERLGIPLGTVKTRLRLAFDKLRSTLAPMKDWIA